MAAFSITDLLLLGCIHICSLIAACQALLTKRDPRSALGWTVTLAFLPVIGLIVYLIFGIGRAHSRAEKIMRRVAIIASRLSLPQPAIAPRSLNSAEARTLAMLGARLTGAHICGGNSITPLHNGDEAYPAMIGAINAAKSHVFLSTYIFNYGHAAQMFISALEAARGRGADVRVIVDGVGCLYSLRKPVKILAQKGVRTALFRPVRLFPPNLGINLRSHRKVLVCDNVGFTGGMNIADGNLLKINTSGRHKIQDVQFRCEGPIVRQLRRAFLLNWAFCANEFTALEPLDAEDSGPCDCRVVVDGPGNDSDALNDIICGAINLARKRVLIMTPYFLPTPSLTAALQSCAQRGVDTRVLLPGHNNLNYVGWAMQRIMPAFLQAGARIWYQAPPFAHTKLLVVDDFYSIIGSANLDSRSLLLNFELNMEVYDKEFNSRLATFMENTLRKGREVTLPEIRALSLPARLRNAICWIFSPYL